jgi:hypothetical protein
MDQWLKAGMLQRAINIDGVFTIMPILEMIQKVRHGRCIATIINNQLK